MRVPQLRRQADDHWNPDRLGEQVELVPPAAVLAEQVAVIAGQHDDAVVVEALLLEMPDELAEAAVDALDSRRIGFVEALVALAAASPPLCVQDVDVHRREID